jgi:SOS response regulatory protein OraA/RecX
MEEAPDNESQIEAYLASRLRGRMIDEKEKKRLVDGLLRRGYPWSDVKRVMSRMLETYFED